MVLIDSNIAINLRDGDRSTIAALARQRGRPAISILTRIELEGGIHAVPALAAERERRWKRLLPDLTVLPLDPAVVAAYVDIVRQIGFSRRLVIDRLIAATAIVHDLALATANIGDFRDVPGLTLEEWPTG